MNQLRRGAQEMGRLRSHNTALSLIQMSYCYIKQRTTVNGIIMARYATTERLYKCPLCDAQFAIREAEQIPNGGLTYECPQCEDAYIAFAELENVSDGAGGTITRLSDNQPNERRDNFTWWGSRSGEVERMQNPNTWNREIG